MDKVDVVQSLLPHHPLVARKTAVVQAVFVLRGIVQIAVLLV